MPSSSLTPYQNPYYAWLRSRPAASDSLESLASTLVDSRVDANPRLIVAPANRGIDAVHCDGDSETLYPRQRVVGRLSSRAPQL